ncbi:hypothetical protein BGW42_003391 [Actinomortierella wolfii]|nr:hypothetical protein BGW42_003391 [Actinomortierella wolfii]
MSRSSQQKQSPLEIQELLSAILAMTDRATLPNCSLVARSWYLPAMHALWRYVQWKPLLETGNALFLEGLAKYGRYTLELQDSTMADLDLIAKFCPQLQCLRLSITALHDMTLTNVLLHSPKITSLHLFCCRELTGESLKSMATLTHLRTLNLRNLQQVDEPALMELITRCQELTYLYLEDVNLKDISLRGLRQSEMHLKLETLSLIRSGPRSELIANLLRCSPRLKNLTLARSSGVVLPAPFLQEAHESLANLVLVDFESCRLISNDAMRVLFTASPGLVRINVMGTVIEDSGLRQLANSCLSLERLNLAFCHHITDTGARYVLDHCARLKSINLTSQLGLTADIFFGPKWRCRQLESLVLMDIDMSRAEHHQSDHHQGEVDDALEESRGDTLATNEEQDLIAMHTCAEGDSNHVAMFRQLSQLHCLKDLTLGGSNMSIRLADGLDKLGTLPCLESWHVQQLEGTLADEEIRWLIEAWPKSLKRVRYDRNTLPKPWMRYYRRSRPHLLFA